MKTQVVVDKHTRQIICTAFSNGKRHDFKLFKDSKVHARADIEVDVDTGYLGINNIHLNSMLPRKKSKHHPLSKEDKMFNRAISSHRVSNEQAIGFLKRFKIIAERYRNRRKPFSLRFNLIVGLCNFDLLS